MAKEKAPGGAADPAPKEVRLEDLMVAKERSLADEKGRHHLSPDAYGYRWFRVGGPPPRP